MPLVNIYRTAHLDHGEVGYGFAVRGRGLVVPHAAAVLGEVQIVKRTDDLSGFQVCPRRGVVERTLAWIGDSVCGDALSSNRTPQ
ncbi:hypothetical protein [Pseudonocardia charpentierae]|uniref:hypothetical protein n=1 Tax=Pseudonocardia charpentierae TaxID=3075545 RepID=UPI0037CBE483